MRFSANIWLKAPDLILAKGPRPNLGLTCIRSNVYLGPTLVYQKGAKWSADFILGTCICKGGEGVTSDAWFPSFAPPPLCFQNYNIMTSQPVTFNNLNHKRVSSILCWLLSLFIAIFHIARGRTFDAFSKNPSKDDMTLVWYLDITKSGFQCKLKNYRSPNFSKANHSLLCQF